ncbi:MAG: GAD-like domain-containing protein [Actinomycetaceae bacterium]|nr:GAD-like domain-containing protein [Actinomycetaceae bacterium]
MTNAFFTEFTPTATQPIPESTIEEYRDLAPPALVEIWETHGVGHYRDGLIEFIDPAEYESAFWAWFPERKPNYLPFAVTAFGDYFYYRKLSDAGDEDVCFLDLQYRECTVLDWSIVGFLHGSLCDAEFRADFLREPLFHQAVEIHGPLPLGHSYAFAPVLALGGDPGDASRLYIGDTQVYQDIVLQLGA